MSSNGQDADEGNADPLADANGAQHTADAQMLAHELGNARGQLACLKIAYYAAKADITITFTVAEADEQKTRVQKLGVISRMIEKAERNCAKLQAMYEDISDGRPIPTPEVRPAR